MWRSATDFCVDIAKKLLVSVVAAPILSIVSILLFRATEGFFLAYDSAWYYQYWFLVLLAAMLSVIQGCVIYGSLLTITQSMLISLLFLLIYISFALRNDLKLGDLYNSVPLWVFFLVLNVTLFQVCLILCYFAQKLAASILAASRSHPERS